MKIKGLFVAILLLAIALMSTEGLAAADPDDKTIRIDVSFEDISEFY